MALFTIDDLEYLENEGGKFFHHSEEKEIQSPTVNGINTILNYSRALSVRSSAQLNEIHMILN